MQLMRSLASSPDTAVPVSSLQVGAHLFVARLSEGPEPLDRERLDELVERALPCIEAEDMPLEVGLLLLEKVVLALLGSEPPAPRRHLSLVPGR